MAKNGLAQRIERARKTLGLSVTAAAELLGVSRKSWTMWEKVGASNPRPEQMESLAQLLHVSADWLANGDDPDDFRVGDLRVRSIERMYIERLWEAHQGFNKLIARSRPSDGTIRQRRQADECLRVLLERSYSSTAPFVSEYHVSRDMINIALLESQLHRHIVLNSKKGFPELAVAIDVAGYVREMGYPLPVAVLKIESIPGEPLVCWYDSEGHIVARILIDRPAPALTVRLSATESISEPGPLDNQSDGDI